MAQFSERELFETVPVPRAVATLAVPTVISQVVTMIYNLADTFFIGQTGSGFSILRITIKLLFIRINVPIEEVLQNVIRHGGHPPFSQCPPHRPRSGRCRCPSA